MYFYKRNKEKIKYYKQFYSIFHSQQYLANINRYLHQINKHTMDFITTTKLISFNKKMYRHFIKNYWYSEYCQVVLSSISINIIKSALNIVLSTFFFIFNDLLMYINNTNRHFIMFLLMTL